MLIYQNGKYKKQPRRKKTAKQKMEDREDRRYAENLPFHLKGLGNNPLVRPRGLRGFKFGPANDGRELDEEEKKKIEEDLRKRGLL